MASYTARKNKAGEVVSYQIKVSRGRDKLTGKQLTPFTTTYTPPDGWSRKAVERDLIRFMGEFEAACKRGEVLTREQEKALALEQQEQARKAQEEAERKPTFAQYMEQFLLEKSAYLATTTIAGYREALNHALPVFGAMRMEDIDSYMARKYVTDLQTAQTNEKTGGLLSHGTVIKRYTVLHTFFESAVENEVIEVNPFARVKKPKPRKDEVIKDPIVYDESEIDYILECMNKEPLKWRALVLFLIDSGCRRGEVAGLKWEEINFATGEVKICRNVQYIADRGVYVSTPKNKKNRTIIINSPVLRVLKEWKRQQALEFIGRGVSTNGFCFTTGEGGLMSPNTITTYFLRFAKRYNLPGFHPHALRHTMATISIANGADVVSVSRKLGHSNPSITLNIYTHANEEAQKRAAETMANVIDYTKIKHA